MTGLPGRRSLLIRGSVPRISRGRDDDDDDDDDKTHRASFVPFGARVRTRVRESNNLANLYYRSSDL